MLVFLSLRRLVHGIDVFRYPDLRPSPGLQPATRTVAGFRYAVLRAALHPRSSLPPPRRSVGSVKIFAHICGWAPRMFQIASATVSA